MAEFIPIAVVAGHFECLAMAHGSGVPELARALAAILKLRATRFHRAGADRKTVGGVGLIMEMFSVILKIVQLALDQFAKHTAHVAHGFGQALQGRQHLGLLAVAALVQQRLNPGLGLFGLGLQSAGHCPQVFGAVIKIQFLDGVLETIFDDVPNPNRAITNNENIFGVCQAPA